MYAQFGFGNEIDYIKLNCPREEDMKEYLEIIFLAKPRNKS